MFHAIMTKEEREESVATTWARLVTATIAQNLKEWIDNGWQDRQWFLDFKDELNRLSIDEDRRDTKVEG